MWGDRRYRCVGDRLWHTLRLALFPVRYHPPARMALSTAWLEHCIRTPAHPERCALRITSDVHYRPEHRPKHLHPTFAKTPVRLDVYRGPEPTIARISKR